MVRLAFGLVGVMATSVNAQEGVVDTRIVRIRDSNLDAEASWDEVRLPISSQPSHCQLVISGPVEHRFDSAALQMRSDE
jgi:hypothetical protein